MEKEDLQLIERSREGDLAAFNAVVERYQSHVYNLAARILSDKTAAEDVTQETFISAYRALKGFRGGSLRAWLLRIAANHCYDALRSRKRRAEESLDQSLLNPSFTVVSRAESPEEQALRGELGAEIQRAIMELPADQRITMVLIDLQGLSYEEAAEATGASLGTVKSRLSRARSHVRDYLKGRRDLLPEQYRSM